MPEQGAVSVPDTPHDLGSPQELTDTVLHIRALATPFSKNTMIPDESGGLLIKGVPLLAQGTWTDSAVGTPLYYPKDTLRQYAENWLDTATWSRHLGTVPRDITDKVGEVRSPRYENDSIVGDIYLHGGTQKSRDVVELVKRKLVSYVSVEHGGTERMNPETRQMEAASLTFYGLAIVNKGACKLCRINEAAPAPVAVTASTTSTSYDSVTYPYSSYSDNVSWTYRSNGDIWVDSGSPPAEIPNKDDTMEVKELEAQVEALKKELEAVKAAPAPVDYSKELETLKKELEAIKAQPAAPVTAPVVESRELGTVETVITFDKKTGTIRGV